MALAALTSCANTPQSDIASTSPWHAPIDEAPTPTPEPLPLALIFGDSWTHGLAASDSEHAYPHLTGELLGWDVDVLGENGSGYLHLGEDGGFYGTRVAELDPELEPDVVIVQGSVNDRREALSALPRAARSVWHAFEHTYPDAHLVILGPAPSAFPLDKKVKKIDAELAQLADAEGIDYISPLAEEWFTPQNVDDYIDTETANHPSDAGHAYFAKRLSADLERLNLLSPDETAPDETASE